MSTKKEHTVKRILAEKIEELKASQNTRLDDIEKFVRGELAKINDRNKAINGFVVGNNSSMQQKIYNMELTIDAYKELFSEANLLEGLVDKLTTKRSELHERYAKEAEEQMRKNTQQAEAVAEASEPVPAEAPAPQPEELKQETSEAQG